MTFKIIIIAGSCNIAKEALMQVEIEAFSINAHIRGLSADLIILDDSVGNTPLEMAKLKTEVIPILFASRGNLIHADILKREKNDT